MRHSAATSPLTIRRPERRPLPASTVIRPLGRAETGGTVILAGGCRVAIFPVSRRQEEAPKRPVRDLAADHDARDGRPAAMEPRPDPGVDDLALEVVHLVVRLDR